MQMETWRRRGFVPDSDDEDELDSLETKNEVVNNAGDTGDVNDASDSDVDLEYLPEPFHEVQPLPTSTNVIESTASPGQPIDADIDAITISDTETVKAGKAELVTSPTIEGLYPRKLDSQPKDLVENLNDWTRTSIPSFDSHTTRPRRAGLKKYGKRLSTTKSTNSHPSNVQDGPDVYDIPNSSPPASTRKPRDHGREPTPKASPSTNLSRPSAVVSTNSQEPSDFSANRSSSPGVLNLEAQPAAELSRINQLQNESALEQENSDTDSPLSSAPSSPKLPDFEASQELGTIDVGPQHDPLEQFTPEMPRELEGQMEAQPAQRRFRQRNAAQMHPYVYELARYNAQLKGAGYKLQRMRVEERTKRAQQTTDQTNEHDEFNPDSIRSSPPPEEYISPARFSARSKRRQDEETKESEQHSHKKPRTTAPKTPASKRRKSASGASHDAVKEGRQMLQVVIKPPSTHRPDTSALDAIWQFSSSSPEPDVAGGSETTPKPRFRYPPGFGSSPIDPDASVQSKSDTPQVDQPVVRPTVEELDSDTSFGNNEDSDSSHSSGELDESIEAREMRKYQRKTRGVLPASYFRLTHNGSERKTKQQRNQPHQNALAHRTDGKGVARKIVRKQGPFEIGNFLKDLADSDDSDDETRNENTQAAEQNNADKDSALEFTNTFDGDDQDILEGNEVDYMLSAIPRNASSSNRQKGLKRPKSRENANRTERETKRARLKRQTRLTDASYGGSQRGKSSKTSVPKSASKKSASKPASRSTRLGILDAPDVVSRSHQEQPQFLRIAARGARSRRDAGRQSPTRKFFQLGSKTDTLDVNRSLQEWKKGKIRQSKTSQPKPKPRKQQQLTNFLTGVHRAAPSLPRTRVPDRTPAAPSDIVMIDDEHSTSEQNASAGTPAPWPTSVAQEHNKASVQPKQPERLGNHWIVRRNVVVSSLRRNTPRPDAASLVEADGSQATSAALFNRSLTLLNRDYRQNTKDRPFKSNLPLNRYISSTGSLDSFSTSRPKPTQTTQMQQNDSYQPTILEHQNHRRRLKKSTPRRINLDADEFRHFEEPADDVEFLPLAPAAPSHHLSFGVGGLFNWQSSYSPDFGIEPLPAGTFFHETSFLGSGTFSRSLQLRKRNLDCEAKSSSIAFNDRTFRWGAWNDAVASQMGFMFDMMIVESEKCIASSAEMNADLSLTSECFAFRSLITYVADNLSFIDPVDRESFVKRAMGLVSRLREKMTAFVSTRECSKNGLVALGSYNLVFANEIHQVSTHPLVGTDLATDALNLVKACAKDAISLALSEAGIAELRHLLEEIKSLDRRDRGIFDDFPSATAFVVTVQILRSSESFNGLLADLETEIYTNCLLRNQKDITNLEFAWYSLFTVLPLKEINDQGIARSETLYKASNDNWSLVKRLLSPALDSCETSSTTQPISYNSYCRTIFQRCHRLINLWGWRDCKPILDTLYDFFARKLLHNLKLEESRTSPSFLDDLDKKPSLDIRVGEPCFHTLLKIIASGLRFLSMKYDKKKLRNFAWRLLPNNGYDYPMDRELLEDDLAALRNHHDLLCTLYWAVPDGSRPRLEAIRNLVHPATSHRATCKINLKSWLRLVRFKLSTDEDLSDLESFAEWNDHFITELAQKHSDVRNEIEAQNQNDEFALKQVESIISKNKRQIEISLNMAISGLRSAVDFAPSIGHAYRLISKTPFNVIMHLFDGKRERVNDTVAEGLQVIAAYVEKDYVSSLAINPVPAATASFEDDSQEFEGFDDWDDLGAVLVPQEKPTEEIEHVQTVLRPIVFQVVSNYFGQERSPEDPILLAVVDCWASVAHMLVRRGMQHWDDYLSPLGSHSWSELRQTLQTRKYTAYFLAVCIEKDPHILTESRNLVMETWISSLVERSSILKFQHRLTAAVLNGRPQDPMLQNLPFTTSKQGEKYSITLHEVTQRRVLLLSSVLSNMREHVLKLEDSESQDLFVTKREYSELLQRLMTAMKVNYCELGRGDAESAQGAYVEFVHHIIQFLQELTSDIKPVDPFFTDPTLFPLPTTDPRYIVAKLKRYEPKLSSHKEVQTLTIFIQSIVERATVECQQSQLVDQLHTAIKNTHEAGRRDKPTLRAVLLQCVFPAYIELAFSTPAAWLLSHPIILSTSLLFRDLLFNMNTHDSACVSSLLGIFDAVFQASYRALRPLATYPRRFKDPVILSMFAEILQMISSSLVIVDYIDRVADAARGLISYILWFRDLSTAVSSELNNSEPGTASDASISAIPTPNQVLSDSAAELPQHLATGRRVAFEDHQSYLRIWTLHGGKYYYTRQGHDPKEVPLDPGVFAAVQFEAAAKTFQDASANISHSVDHYGFFLE